MLLTFAPAAQAQVKYVIRHAEQLTDDKKVRSFRAPYLQATSAMALYRKCGTQLEIPEDQQHYLATHFEKLGQDYMMAFDTAFRAETGGPSPQELVADYTAYLQKLQQRAINDTETTIKKSGCHAAKLRNLISHYHKQRQLDAAAEAEQTTHQ